MNKTILIVGGGIGGLTAGVYAAKAGFRVRLYEKHQIVGGECTGWDRQGCHIDNCVHWLMGTTPGSDLYDLWETVGALGPGVEVLRFDRMYTSALGQARATLWADGARTRRELLALSPEDGPEIDNLMKSCFQARGIRIPAAKPPEMMGPLDGIKMMLTAGGALKLFRRYQGQDTQDLMNRFRHPLIRALISDFCTKESMASSFPMAYGNFLSGDGGVPRGGSRAMARRMGARLEALGGQIFTGRAARKILLEGDRAIGLELEDGERVAGDYVVPACDASVTFSQLLPREDMPAMLARMYENRAAYPVYGTFQTAFMLDMERDLIGPDLMLECAPMMPGMSDRITLKSYAYEPDFAPPGRQVIQTMTGECEALYDYWAALDRESYADKKREFAQKTQAFLEARFPEARGKLTLLDAWTPMTYRRYTDAYKGFYQAFTPTKYSERLPYPPAVLERLPNVVLAGQWLNPPGGLPGAATAGKFSIQRILRMEGVKG